MSQEYLTVVRRHPPHRLRQLTYESAVFQSELGHVLRSGSCPYRPVTGKAARIDKAADISEGIGERHPLTPSLFHICKSAAAISLSPSPSPSLAAPWSRIRWMPPAGSVWRGGHELEAPPRDHTSGCIGDETATSTRPQIGRAHV